MKIRIKRVISLLVALCLCWSYMPTHANAASNITICGVDIGIAAGSYMQFTTSDGTNSNSGYYYNGYYLAASQCFGFARWCQYKLFGYTSYSNSGGFYKISVDGINDIAAGSLTTTNLKKMITAAKPGAHLRTHENSSGVAHSMVITEVTDAGFSIAQCNGSNNNEYSSWKQNYVGTYTYTWSSYVSSTYGARGIDYIEMPYEYQYTTSNVDVGTNFYAYIINTGHWKHLTNDGNNVSMRSETGAPNQVWYFERQSDLSYKITSVYDGNCMEVCNFGTSDGTNVQTYPYNGNTAQFWHISGASGAYVFRATCADTVLDICDNSSADGTNVQMWTYNGTGAQLFQIWKLDDYDISVPSTPTVSLNNSTYNMKSGNYVKDRENVTINWSASNADSYRIKIRQSGSEDDAVNCSVGNNTSYTFSPPAEGKYTVSIRANNEAGSSSWASRDFYIRGIYGKHWVSASPGGDTVTSFRQGDRIYFNFELFDKATGDLLYSYYNGSFPVTMSIIDPNGTTVATQSYTKDDNDYISYVCTTLGTYTTEATLNNAVYTRNFTVSANSYTISYNANGGSGAPGNQTKQHNTPLTLSSTIPSGKSYTITFNGNGGMVSESNKRVYQQFNHWNTKANGSGASYLPGSTYSDNADCTLYAHWDAAERGSVADPIRDGYHFLGWYDSTATNSDGNPVGMKYSTSTDISSNITLYAMWASANKLYYGDVDIDGSVTFTDVAFINKYLLGNTSLDYSIEEFLLRADLDRNGEITDNDRTLANSLRLNQMTPAEFAKAYTSTELSVAPKRSYAYGESLDTTGLAINILFDTGISYTISEGLIVSGYDPYQSGTQTLTVQYYQFIATYTVTVSAQEYTVSYNANGGSNAPSNQIKQHGTPLVLSSMVPTRFGYTFLGWSTNSNAISASHLPGGHFTANADTTLYAVWKNADLISTDVANNNYTFTAKISFANGCQYYQFTPIFSGKLQFESEGDTDTQIYLYDANGNLLSSDDDSGEDRNFLLNQSIVSGTTYYVKVQCYSSTIGTIPFVIRRAYDITYNANGGSNAPVAQIKGRGVTLILSTMVPTRSNHIFLGWSTSSYATSASYQPGDTFTANANTTLYAVWRENCDSGHSYNYKVTRPPTTSATGTLTGTCSRCSGTTTVILPMLNTTDYSYSVTKSATCTAVGTGRYTWKTTTYGTYYFDINIAAAGHSWNDGIVIKQPTEFIEGEILYTCTICGDTRTESIPVIGHEHHYEAVVTEPTCTNQGYTTYYCACGDSYVKDYTDALGHSFGSWVVIKEPSKSEDGLEIRICTRCGFEVQRTIAKRENPFTDVPEDSFYYEPVMWAVENGITSGTSETTFSPNNACLRAQVVTFLWRAEGCPEPSGKRSPFVDVTEKDFYYKAVLWAVENGVTTGADATHFNPFGVCNRAQVVTFLYRAVGSPAVENAVNPFTDVPTGSWYSAPVLWAVENGITNGLSATQFGPNTNCNRAQIVTFLYRAYS